MTRLNRLFQGIAVFIAFIALLGVLSGRAHARITSAASDDIWCAGPSGAEVCVDVSGNLVPTTNNDTSLGTSSLKWASLHLTAGGLTDSAIEAGDIASNAVETAKLINGAVTVNKLADSAVETAKIATDAVTSAKILNATIAATDLASNAVETAKLIDGAVTTDKIADSAVNTNKLATDAVTSAKILDGTIAAADLASSAVETAKVATGAIDTAKFNMNNTGIVDSGKLFCVVGGNDRRIGVCAAGTVSTTLANCDCQ